MSDKNGSDIRLTDEQRSIVENNHNLIYKFARIYGISIDEFYDLLAIGLCNAARIYNPSRGVKFSVLAFQCMRSEYLGYLKNQMYRKRSPSGKLISYDEPITDSSEPLTILDTIADESASIDTTEVVVKEFIETVPERYRNILLGLISGKTQTEVAEEAGCTKQNITRVRNLLREYWKSYSIKL